MKKLIVVAFLFGALVASLDTATQRATAAKAECAEGTRYCAANLSLVELFGW